MALKADREVIATEIGFYLNEVANKGSFVSINTAGSGVALDQVKSVATVAAVASGSKPLGMLLNEFVSVDQTRFPINWHKDQANSGDKATILTHGWAVTDKITGNPNAGDYAVLYNGGTVSGVALGGAWNETANPKIGRFRSAKDQDGFAKVFVNL